MIEKCGVIHIHTKYSDGSGTIEEIAACADQLALDYIVITDHITLRSLHQGKEGFYGKTFVLIGYELHDEQHMNHYLILGTDRLLPHECSAEQYILQAKRQGGIGVIAHPDEVRSSLPGLPPYPWLAWNSEGYDGIEIWNQFSQWAEKLTRWNFLHMLISPRKFTRGPKPKLLAIWDKINEKRKVAGLGGVDVHAFPYRLGPLRITIFPYKVQFQAVRTHILLDSQPGTTVANLKRYLLRAIMQANLFVSNYRWGDARGFRFFAENIYGRAFSGQELPYDQNTIFTIELPAAAESRLLRQGQVVATATLPKIELKCKAPGIYRLEVFRKQRGWIYSNHIRII